MRKISFKIISAIGLLFILFTLIGLNTSCSQSKNITNTEKNNLKSYTIDILEHLNGFDGDINMDDLYLKYHKKDTTFIISSYVPSNKFGRLIRYFKSYYDSDSMQNKSHYLFNLCKDNLSYFVINDYYSLENGNKKNVNSDTIYFKKDKLFFWKNKNPSKNEVLAKESEILAIKREIDSVLND